jgi:hypothetical protein
MMVINGINDEIATALKVPEILKFIRVPRNDGNHCAPCNDVSFYAITFSCMR